MANILLTGATGYAGGRALTTALADPGIAKVTVITRRELPADPARAKYESKLNTILVPDVGKLDWDSLTSEAWWRELNGCVWAMGQPFHKVNTSLEEYERMTVDYPLACASRLPNGCNFVFITGATVTQNEDAWFMVETRNLKGRAEKLLLEIEGLTVVILRPGGIIEKGAVQSAVHWLTPAMTIYNDELAQVAVAVAQKGRIADRTVWMSRDMRAFVAEQA